MDDEAAQAAVLADAMTDAMVVAERNSLDDQPRAGRRRRRS
jgi:hypothetical protein